MKKLIFCVVAIFIVLSATAMAEPLDEVWIIKENTGSPETMEKLSSPNLSPNQTIEVYIEEKGLSAKWGEGFAYYTYTYYSERERRSGLQRGTSRKKNEQGYLDFFPCPADNHTRRHSGRHLPYRLRAHRLSHKRAVSWERPLHGRERGRHRRAEGSEREEQARPIRRGRLPYHYRRDRIGARFRGEERQPPHLQVQGNKQWRYERRVPALPVSNQHQFRNRGRSLPSPSTEAAAASPPGSDFPPEVTMKADFYFKRPVPGRVSHISYLEIPFYSKDDKVIWKDIPVPWPTNN